MPLELNAVMIESSFLSNSLWAPDHPLDNLDLVSHKSPFDFDETSFDYDSIESPSLEPSFSSQIDTYSNSSDYDYIPYEFTFSDDFVSEIFSLEEDSGLTDLSIDVSENIIHDEKKSDSPIKTFNDAVEWLTQRTFWSKRSSSEQTLTLNAISYLVTHHLSIENQMDVITIINPKIVIRPEDKEFCIDASDISDCKLWKIKEYLKKNVPKFKDLPQDSVTSKESCKRSSAKFIRSKSNLNNYPRTKRKQKSKNRKVASEPDDNKLVKQTKKEMKSGFFVYEKKLKLSSTSSTEEEEDINVLE